MATPLIWMPLNGNMDNLGIGTVVKTSTAIPAYYADGKIGKAYNLNVRSVFACEELSGLTSFSICFWVKMLPSETQTANWQDIVCFYDASKSGTNGYFRWESGYGTSSSFHGAHWHDNATNAIVDGSFTHFTERNVWHHCAITVENGVSLKSFTDGLLKSTITTKLGGGHLRSNFHIGETNAIEGAINDLRVYDHALSEKEIHDISKALVLHYPLDDNGYDRSNDMPNSIGMALGSANAKLGIWRNAGSSTMTRSRVLINDSPIGACYGFQNSGIQTPNDGSCYGIDSFPTDSNTDYVISLWARIIDGTEGYAGFNIYSSSMLDGFEKVDKNYRVTRLPSDGSWKRAYCHFKTNANVKRNIYIGVTTGSSNVTTQMCAVKLEKGTMPTMWSPAPSDIVSYESSDILDTSGFHNNGTSNSVSIVVDSPRYCAATNLKSTKQIINTLVPTFISNGSCTFWAKVVENGSIGWIPVCDSSSTSRYLMASKSDGSNSYNGGLSHTVIYYEDGAVVKKPTFDGLWHHYAITNISFSASWDSLRIGSTNTGWSGDVSYSDFRLYSTVLTPEDIKELYEVGASIDNLQNTHTHWYIEDPTYSNPSITKTGIVKESELEEADKASLFSSGKVTAKEIIEI